MEMALLKLQQIAAIAIQIIIIIIINVFV